MFGGRGEERFGFGGAVFGLLVPGAVERDFGVGDGDGAGCGFAACGFRDLDAGGLLGLDLRPPCRVNVGGVGACLRLPLQGGARFGCGFGVRARRGVARAVRFRRRPGARRRWRLRSCRPGRCTAATMR